MNIDYLVETGRKFGYPECCIKAFISRTMSIIINSKIPPLDKNQSMVHQGYGFIPCSKCSEHLVKTGEGVETLIKNRTFPKPFPIDK